MTGFWKRDAQVAFMKSRLVRGTQCVLLGQPCVGKSALMNEVLRSISSIDTVKISIDCRAMDFSSSCRIEEGFKLRFQAAAKSMDTIVDKVGDKVKAMAPKVVDMLAETLLGVDTQLFASELNKAAESPSVIAGLNSAITTIHGKGGKVVIFIDEINLLQSKGDPNQKWRDQFFAELMHLFARITKQEKDGVCRRIDQ